VIAVEIPVPKCEFGTDFIAVVCRGWVVDILLLSDRTSVYDCARETRIQTYVNTLSPPFEKCETDIEVTYGNNVYVVRMMDGAPHIMIPALGMGDCAGYLTSHEKRSVLALARSTLSEGIVEIVSDHECGSEAQCLSTAIICEASVGAAVERRAVQGIGAEGAVSSAKVGKAAGGDTDIVHESKRTVSCDQCKILSLNGVPWHEAGCRNEHKAWNPTAFPLFSQDPDFGCGEWVNQTKERANGTESEITFPVGAGTNNAKSSTTSPTWRILAVDDEESQLVLPFISEEERQRGFERALYRARRATRGKTVTSAEIDALEQEYVDYLRRQKTNVDGVELWEK
jgi:hypothetical protein